MRIVRSENGSILLEFALVLPPMVLILSYMVNYALWIQKAMQLQDAASAAAAFGAIPGNTGKSPEMQALANLIATGSTSGASWFTVTATNFYTCSPGGTQVTATTSCSLGAPYHYVKVTTTANPTALLGYQAVPAGMGLSGSATYRVEVTP